MSIEIPVSGRGMFDLDVTFFFREDPGKEAGFTVVNALENMNPEDIGSAVQFDITVYNSARAGSVSNDKPLALGELFGTVLYLNFVAEGRDRSAHKVLHYSLYTA
jgi:hypothetical protein